MIYTITLNPSIDYIIKVDNFKLGEVNRSEMDCKYPGGKGINISRVLNNLGIKNKALGFVGGFTGDYITTFLKKEGVDVDFIKVNGDTRINVKLKSNQETEINGGGPCITPNDLDRLLQKSERLRSEDFLVLAGNAQQILPRDVYSQIQQRCFKNNVKVVIDTTGDALTSTLKYEPFLIKPNHYELGEIFNVEIKTKNEIIYYGQKMLGMGARNIIVSMAGEGAILISEEGAFHGLVPKGIVKNSVGAGDSLIGGFLANFSQSGNIVESFQWGLASGSATAFSMDLCKRHEVEDLLDQVKIIKL